jgi:hypothetical protein
MNYPRLSCLGLCAVALVGCGADIDSGEDYEPSPLETPPLETPPSVTPSADPPASAVLAARGRRPQRERQRPLPLPLPLSIAPPPRGVPTAPRPPDPPGPDFVPRGCLQRPAGDGPALDAADSALVRDDTRETASIYCR